jgi:EXPERA (EXPanded EBP superfamily)
LGAIVVGTQIAVVTSLCLWEIWAFDESVVTREQKLKLNSLYIPFLVTPIIMVVDMLGRVNRRVQVAEQAKKKA